VYQAAGGRRDAAAWESVWRIAPEEILARVTALLRVADLLGR
jgi:hypothetical protein